MNYAAIERAIIRAQVFEIAVLAIVLIVSTLVTYYIIKIAVREALRESGLVRALNNIAAAQRRDNNMPDMRAD